jgi:hypothetical protein
MCEIILKLHSIILWSLIFIISQKDTFNSHLLQISFARLRNIKIHFKFITLKLYHIDLFSYIIFVGQNLKLFFGFAKVIIYFKYVM